MHLIFTLDEISLNLIDRTFFEVVKIPDENYDDDIDSRIDSFLYSNRNNSIKSFTLPLSLTSNFMEFSGLIFAHHVRLNRDMNHCDAPIILYGVLEIEQLLRLNKLANILLTKNVLYVNITKYSFEDIKKSIERYDIKSFNLNYFIETIQIDTPKNYESHHSIDNEFALIRWSKYIGIYENLPFKLRSNFNCSLYFKYLRAKHPVPDYNIENHTLTNLSINTKILLVDDEANKGWKYFYDAYFNSSKIEFKDSNIEFNNKEKNDIISEIETIIKNFIPDIVLLDLRLHDSDFTEDVKPEYFTGLKVLEYIKKINKGIQVIITTASNKVWNYNLAKQNGALEFIIKNGFDPPENSLNRLNNSLKIAAKRAIYLKSVNEENEKIKLAINNNTQLDDNNNIDESINGIFKNEIKTKFQFYLDSAFEILDECCEFSLKERYYSYCYLQLFLIIEDFIKLESVFTEGTDCFVYLNKHKFACVLKSTKNQIEGAIKFNKTSGNYIIEKNIINTKKRLDTNFKVSTILIFCKGNSNSSVQKWTDIYTVRNKVAHEGYLPNIFQIKDLLNFIYYLLNIETNAETNIEKGLPQSTFEERLKNLKEIFNKR